MCVWKPIITLRPKTARSSDMWTTHDHMLKCTHQSHSLSLIALQIIQGFPGDSDGKESVCNAGDLGSVPGLGRSPGEGSGNPLQYSCLENSMDREELGRIQSMGSQMTEQLSTSMDHSASWLAFCPSLSWILHCSCWRKGKSLSSLRWKDWCPCQVRDPIVWSNELADWRVLRIMVCLPAPHGSLQRPFWFHRLVFTEKMSMPKEPLKRWNKALELQMM